ncbi:hypothetical protein ATY77_27430 [Rhizobium sp. R634]|nr:hypothetical protein ATY77_27430 [Rhizobium sp. R634]
MVNVPYKGCEELAGGGIGERCRQADEGATRHTENLFRHAMPTPFSNMVTTITTMQPLPTMAFIFDRLAFSAPSSALRAPSPQRGY